MNKSTRPARYAGVRKGRHVWFLFSLVFIIALAARIAVFLTLSDSPFFLNPVIDAEYHDSWARALAAEDPNEGQRELLSSSFFKPPLYPYLLAGSYRLFGRTLWHVKVVQAVIGTAGCLMVSLIGRRLFGLSAGLIAGFLAAVYWPWMFFDAWLLNTELVIFLNLLTVLILLKLPDQAAMWRPAAAGLVAGLSCITWPTGLLLLVALAVWIWRAWPRRENLRRGYLAAIVFLVVAAAPVALVAARNIIVGRDWVLISSNGGINFYTGNRPEADGFSAVPTGLEWERLIRETREAGIPEADLSGASNYWLRKGLHHMADTPGRTLLLAAKKAALFFNAAEPRNNIAQAYLREQYRWLKALPRFAIVGPLALVGMWLAIRGKPDQSARSALIGKAGAWLCLLVICISIISVLPFFVCDRFRIVAVPFMLPFAGLAAHHLWSATKLRRWSRLVTYAPVIIVLAVLIGVDWFGAEPENFSFEHLYLGTIYLRSNRDEVAEREFRTSLKLSEGPDAMVFLSHVLIRRGEFDEAIDVLQRCLEIAPDAAQAHNNLASCLSRKEQLPEALEHLNKAVQLEPDFAAYRLNRAAALIGLGHPDDAAKDLGRANQLPMNTAELALLRLLRNQLETSD